jgi:hypothetical protein
MQAKYLSNLIEEFSPLTHSAERSPVCKEVLLRINPEQAQAFRPRIRRVDFLPTQTYKTPVMIPGIF